MSHRRADLFLPFNLMVPIKPAREEFERLRTEYPLVPVWQEIAADLETPVSAFLKIVGDRPGFLLESVEHGERWGRYSFIGLDPYLVMKTINGSVEWEGAPPEGLGDGTPADLVRAVLSAYSVPENKELPPLYAGAVGYIGYDFVRYLEELPSRLTADVDAPGLLLMFPGTILAFDHLRQRVMVIVNVTSDSSYDQAVARVNEVAKLLGSGLPYEPLQMDEAEVDVPASTMSKSEFISAVEIAKEHILAGDIFQVVLSHRFSQPLGCDPFDLYRVLRLINPSPYMFFIRHPEIVVAGSSPEPLVKVEGTKIIQRPIAGTRPRGSTPEEDLRIEEEFVKDEKERAEHVMLVDLARNDIGRVARYGSVEVEELMIVERYSHVMHLVSQVSGELAEGKSAIDALYASFPAGTVSGAPKIRAMELIDELEPTARGPYAGVVGYFGFSGNLDTCIALRTAYVVDGTVHIQAGAGIVADSVPENEWEETINKARALLTAVAYASKR